MSSSVSEKMKRLVSKFKAGEKFTEKEKYWIEVQVNRVTLKLKSIMALSLMGELQDSFDVKIKN